MSPRHPDGGRKERCHTDGACRRRTAPRGVVQVCDQVRVHRGIERVDDTPVAHRRNLPGGAGASVMDEPEGAVLPVHVQALSRAVEVHGVGAPRPGIRGADPGHARGAEAHVDGSHLPAARALPTTGHHRAAVSYTHLTLPTIYSV